MQILSVSQSSSKNSNNIIFFLDKNNVGNQYILLFCFWVENIFSLN